MGTCSFCRQTVFNIFRNKLIVPSMQAFVMSLFPNPISARSFIVLIIIIIQTMWVQNFINAMKMGILNYMYSPYEIIMQIA